MPGSGKQSADVQQQIIEFLEAGIDPTTIHRRLKVGRSSIYRMKRSLQQHGTAYAPPETNKKNGRPKVLTAEQELVGICLVTYLLQCCNTDNTSKSLA
jgi:transposase